MDTWLNRDQRQRSLEETDRQRSRRRQLPRSLFSPEIASDSDRYCVSNRNTKRNRERGEGVVEQARQFVVRRPVLQRRRLLRQLLCLAILPVCRCLALSAAGLDPVDADADEMTPLLLRLLRGGCTVVPQHDRNLLDYTLIGHWSRKELTRINDAVKSTSKVKKFNLKQ